jgi:MoxR-like ATPase
VVLCAAKTVDSSGNGKLARHAAVSAAFTPAAPVDDADLFADRPEQVMACVDALFQKGLHVALYGERGVGKTSLANVLPALIRSADAPSLDAIRVDCTPTTATSRSGEISSANSPII